MRIVSIQVGKPRTIQHAGKEVQTGIFKEPVLGPIWLRSLNLEGDGQADLRVHGGADKALYAYSCDAYPAWRKLRPRDEFAWGAMGENLSVENLPEDQIFVGDTFEIGDAIVQAVQPRFPCFKLGIKFNDPGILKQFVELKRPGIYFRVLKEGKIDRGQALKLVDREAVHASISELFALPMEKARDLSRVPEILKLKSLNARWRRDLESWLAGS